MGEPALAPFLIRESSDTVCCMWSLISTIAFIVLELSSNFAPYKNGSVGFSLNLPENATVVATSSNPPSCLISGGDLSDNSITGWHLRVDRSPNAGNFSAKKIALELKNRHETSKETIELQNQAIKIGFQNCHWLLIKEKGEDIQPLFGWLVIPVVGNQYLVANLLTTDAGWESNRAAINGIISSIKALDPVLLIEERLKSIEHSSSFLESLNQRNLGKLVGLNEWRSIQLQQDSDLLPEDIGYMHLVVWEGTADAIEKFEKLEQGEPEGIIISLQSRVVADADKGIVVDSLSQYWMSFDGKNERWKHQTKRWMDGAQVLESETGILIPAKLGQPITKLRVFKENLTSKTIESPFEISIEEPWLPRAMHFVIGELLSKTTEGKKFFWKTFDNTSGQQMVTRIDHLSKENNNQTLVETSFGEQGIVLRTRLDEHGDFISQEQMGGILIKISSPEQLKEIWEPRNLW